jgi:signal transduction histidine kinase
MDTYFASPERTDKKYLAAEIETVNNNPVMTGLLHSISGLLAVLDENRQVIAVNNSFLKFLGIEDSAGALGLRPGEALQCIHSHEKPAGCGTTKYCSTCGAAIAIVSSLGHDKPVERFCSLTAMRNDATIDIALLVRSHPITIDQKRFLLLFLQDITVQQQRSALERTFFHDINNMLVGLVGISEQLSLGNSNSKLARNLFEVSLRLRKEVEMQKCLLDSEHLSYQPTMFDISPMQVMDELKSFFANHPATVNKKLSFSASLPTVSIKTDLSLLLRVLCNMITNALEATDENGTVKIWAEQGRNLLSFCVWNDKVIKDDIALRIFQRNFSTKEGSGRGIGTYSMKLFGETILGGKVAFTTSPKDGTTFKISLLS